MGWGNPEQTQQWTDSVIGLVSLYSGFHIFSSIKYKNIYQHGDDVESRLNLA